MKNRLYYLDNLRTVTIILVVTLHVFLCYMKYAPSWWFVINPEQSMFFTYGVMLIDVPIMPIMFFLAGYFAPASLKKHGTYGFWAGKLKRIVIPWLLGVVFLAPPAMYMILLSRGKSPDYMSFWTGTFWTTMYSQSVFWFLGLLTLFYLTLSGFSIVFPRLLGAARRSKVPSPAFPVLFVALTTGIFLFMNCFYPVDTWITDYYIIVFQPLRLAVYLLYFWLGILAWKRNWFTRQGFNPRLLPWLGLSLASALLYLHFKGMIHARGSEMSIKFGNALGFNLFAFSSMMTGIALFRRFLNSSSPIWRSFSSTSYGIYLFHSLVVYYGAYYLLSFGASPFIKAPVLLGSSVMICWGLTALLKKNGLVREIL